MFSNCFNVLLASLLLYFTTLGNQQQAQPLLNKGISFLFTYQLSANMPPQKFRFIKSVVLLIMTLTSQFLDFPVASLAFTAQAQTPELGKVEAERLMQQGDEYIQVQKYVLAVDIFEKALNIYRKIQDVQGESIVIERLSKLYMLLGKWEKLYQFLNQDTMHKVAFVQRFMQCALFYEDLNTWTLDKKKIVRKCNSRSKNYTS